MVGLEAVRQAEDAAARGAGGGGQVADGAACGGAHGGLAGALGAALVDVARHGGVRGHVGGDRNRRRAEGAHRDGGRARRGDAAAVRRRVLVLCAELQRALRAPEREVVQGVARGQRAARAQAVDFHGWR